MAKTKLYLIKQAFETYGKISLCSGKSFDESFVFHKNKLAFYFNSEGGYTRVIESDIL